ncbi:MAG: 4Fe-4S dicluster domain-containing protein [Candidatus Bathyarchaeia archaeon]
MRNFLSIDIERCTGCRLCEIACSISHFKTFNPVRSRIKVLRFHAQGKDVPVVCRQCGKCAAQEACPKDAFKADPSTGAMKVNPELCVACRLCVDRCLFGAVFVDPLDDSIAVCDLCGGKPLCVEFCATGAIAYVPSHRVGIQRSLEIAEGMVSRLKPREYILPR